MLDSGEKQKTGCAIINLKDVRRKCRWGWLYHHRVLFLIITSWIRYKPKFKIFFRCIRRHDILEKLRCHRNRCVACHSTRTRNEDLYWNRAWDSYEWVECSVISAIVSSCYEYNEVTHLGDDIVNFELTRVAIPWTHRKHGQVNWWSLWDCITIRKWQRQEAFVWHVLDGQWVGCDIPVSVCVLMILDIRGYYCPRCWFGAILFDFKVERDTDLITRVWKILPVKVHSGRIDA